MPERHIPFEQVFNFRDLGGYRAADGRTVRWRTIFRSDAPNLMTEADQRRLNDDLGVVSVIDLRDPGSVSRGASSFLPAAAMHHIPFFDDEALSAYHRAGSTASTEWYLEILRAASETGGIVRAFDLLTDAARYPTMFHCSLGKDRAGVLAMLVLGALGVDDAQILDDYELTEPRMVPLKRRIDDRLRELAAEQGREQPAPLSDGTFAAPREWMAGVIEKLQHDHGSIRGYVAAQGVGASTLDRMADVLLEEART